MKETQVGSSSQATEVPPEPPTARHSALVPPSRQVWVAMTPAFPLPPASGVCSQGEPAGRPLDDCGKSRRANDFCIASVHVELHSKHRFNDRDGVPTLILLDHVEDDFAGRKAVAIMLPAMVQAVGNVLEPTVFANLNATAISALVALVLWGSIWEIQGAILSCHSRR